VAAAVLTAAIRSDGVLATILYVAGLAVVVAWVAGFYLARGERERWFANG
jgi:cytochrome c biogenesis protein CcdA